MKFPAKAFAAGVLLAAKGGLCLAAAAIPAIAQSVDSSLSFFITSVNPGKGANLGGLPGADAHCLDLATKAGSAKTHWKAYLSTQASGGSPAVNAKDRIGAGPWFNAKKVMVAASVADLHSENNKLTKRTALTEKGDTVNGRGDSPNRHDILTGSNLDGTAPGPGTDNTCGNWTSESAGGALLGHHDRIGGGTNPNSWNSAHRSSGCSPANLAGTGGAGLFYCFAAGGATGLEKPALGTETRRLGSYVVAEGGPGAEERRVYRFELAEASDVEVQVLSPKGGKVAILIKGRKPAGTHEVRWNGRSGQGSALPAGVYLVRLLSR